MFPAPAADDADTTADDADATADDADTTAVFRGPATDDADVNTAMASGSCGRCKAQHRRCPGY